MPNKNQAPWRATGHTKTAVTPPPMSRAREEPQGAPDPNERPTKRVRFLLNLEESVLDDLLDLDNMTVARVHVFETLDAPSLAALQMALLVRHELPGHRSPADLRAQLALVWEQLLYRDHAPALPSNDTAPRVDAKGTPLPASRIYSPETSVNHAFAQMFEILRKTGRPASLLLAQRAYAACRLVMRCLSLFAGLFAYDLLGVSLPPPGFNGPLVPLVGRIDHFIPLAVLQALDGVAYPNHSDMPRGLVSPSVVAPPALLAAQYNGHATPYESQHRERDTTTLVRDTVVDKTFYSVIVHSIKKNATFNLDEDDDSDDDDNNNSWIAIAKRGKQALAQRPERPMELDEWPVPVVQASAAHMMRVVEKSSDPRDPDLARAYGGRTNAPATPSYLTIGTFQSPPVFYRSASDRARCMATCSVTAIRAKANVTADDDDVAYMHMILARSIQLRKDEYQMLLAAEPVVLFHDVLRPIFRDLNGGGMDAVHGLVNGLGGLLREQKWPTVMDRWVATLRHMLQAERENTALHRIMRFALGLDPDVLGFAAWLEHSGDAVDLLYGLSVESTHSHPKLKFFDAPCAVCNVHGLATHMLETGLDTAAPLCAMCTGTL